MTPEKQNAGHSAFERLLQYAKTRQEDFNLLLFRYGIERLLYRLSISVHAANFILKGASLFLVWKGHNYRVTKDADLLGIGPADISSITDIFKSLCRLPVEEDDGIKFVSDSVKAIPIREEQSYDGIRVTLVGMLHNARIPLQVDIGFGDIVTPKPDQIEFPTLLGAPPPQLLAYPKYTMVAEKIEAIVHLGIANSRMKDFYDIWLMCGMFDFDGAILCDAIKNTFKRRATLLPAGIPIAFTDEFIGDARKQTQWLAFIRKSRPENIAGDFDTVTEKIKGFLMPVLEAARSEKLFDKRWSPDGPWH